MCRNRPVLTADSDAFMLEIVEMPAKKTFLNILLLTAGLFLILSGVQRIILYDNGKIFIHDIIAESYEGTPYNARLFRPVSASAMNPRPAVLLSISESEKIGSGDYAAVKLAQNGFVVLVVNGHKEDNALRKTAGYIENHIDAGYAYLSTRSFTDHKNIMLVAWDNTTKTAILSRSFNQFSSSAFIVSEDFSGLQSIRKSAHVITSTSENEKYIGHKTLSELVILFRESSGLYDDEFALRTDTVDVTLLYGIRVLRIIVVCCIPFFAVMFSKKENI